MFDYIGIILALSTIIGTYIYYIGMYNMGNMTFFFKEIKYYVRTHAEKMKKY